ncbi:MAG: FapA family protein [Desulfuromonadales bacterium]
MSFVIFNSRLSDSSVKKAQGFILRFDISADGLEATCFYEPFAEGEQFSSDDLVEFIAKAKIVTGIDEDACQQLMKKVAGRERVQRLVIAKGVPMVPGEDGRIEFTDLQKEKPAAGAKKYDQVDMRAVREFFNVAAGDAVAILHPPGTGTPGVTVQGTPLPEKPGAPLKYSLGKRVQLSADGRTVDATGDGRVAFQDGEISVEDVFTVKGDVDFKVGNIAFNGFLEVSGDVLDGFTVKATKGIKVQGNIGKCVIESDGNIVFCGMAGRKEGSISCGGSIKANFITETSVTCAGDVTAEIEIRSCDVKCLGRVLVQQGGIAGGRCVAMKGVETAVAGSATSPHTLIIAGVSFKDIDEITRLVDQLEDTKIYQGCTSAEILKRKDAVVRDSLRGMSSRTQLQTIPKVNVRKTIYGNVEIELKQYADVNQVEQDTPAATIFDLFKKVKAVLITNSAKVNEERTGPLSMVPGTMSGTVSFLPMTALSEGVPAN